MKNVGSLPFLWRLDVTKIPVQGQVVHNLDAPGEKKRHAHHPAFRDVTEKFAGQTRLAADGALEAYGARQPFASDPDGKLWKMWTTVDSWSEEAQDHPEMNKGVSVSRFLGIFVIDVKLCLFG